VEPENGKYHRNLSIAYIRLGDWVRASASFTRATELARRSRKSIDGATSAHDECGTAILHLYNGDLPRYREGCRAMLEDFSQAGNPIRDGFIVLTCSLAPDVVGDPAQLLLLAERALSGTKKAPYHRTVMLIAALANYRTARYTAAVDQLKRY